MLELNKISKKFKNRILFEDVTLSIGSGELIHLQGSNGSGKSTLFKMICDIIKPTSGTITLSDSVRIGSVIENSGFIENEPILYNLKFLYNLKNHFDESKVKKLCDAFELDLYDKKKMKNYSVGMRQKVAIIQAIMEDQNLILFDEPTRGLDKQSVEYFFELVMQLKKEHKTVIIASHDLEKEIDFDRCFKIEDCRIQAI